jgi:hypothetical protein
MLTMSAMVPLYLFTAFSHIVIYIISAYRVVPYQGLGLQLVQCTLPDQIIHLGLINHKQIIIAESFIPYQEVEGFQGIL